MMRLFFAALLPEPLVARVLEVQQQLRARVGDDGVRWTRPDQFHYTLKFLGEQPPARANRAVEAALAAREGPSRFSLTLTGVGAFPNERRPSTLWTGAGEGADRLAELAASLERLLVKEGFARENRPFKPHLTLARIKSYAGEIAAAKALKTAEIGEIGAAPIDRFVLMQSTLKPSGSEYAILEEFAFLQ